MSYLNATKLNTARGSGVKAAAHAAKDKVVVGDPPRATGNCRALLNTSSYKALLAGYWVILSALQQNKSLVCTVQTDFAELLITKFDQTHCSLIASPLLNTDNHESPLRGCEITIEVQDFNL